MPNETRADDSVYYREGQGESSGPSALSAFEALGGRIREQVHLSDIGIWADGANVPLNTDMLGQTYRPTYGSQQRSEVSRWTADTYSARPLTFADVSQTWTEVNSFRETTRERGDQMRFSGQPDPLTEGDKAKLDLFYAKSLKDGFAQWPLDKRKVLIYIDGIPRHIYGDSRWSIESEYIYIGYSLDEGTGFFANPAARLACTAALMGITGHAGKSELIALLSERLAKVMAGVYDTVVKPLASTLDSRPIRRMAWSVDGGLATWTDGAWVGMTGEPVVVGPDWIVVDTNEGPVEDGMPAIGAARPAPNGGASSRFVEFCDQYNYSTARTITGRQYVDFPRVGLSTAQSLFTRHQAEGYQLEWIEEGDMVGFAEALPSTAEPTPLTHAQWVEIKGKFDRWATVYSLSHLEDGRPGVDFADDEEDTIEDMRGYDLVGCVVESYVALDGETSWAITYPPEPPQRNVEDVEIAF